MSTTSGLPDSDPRGASLANYRKKLLEHREMEAKLKDCTKFPSPLSNVLS